MKPQIKKIALFLLAASLVHATTLASFAATTVTWQCSTASALWQDKGTLPVSQWDDLQEGVFQQEQSKLGKSVVVFDSRKYQTVDGWGGCFNERGWKALSVLSPQDRDTALKILFDPKEGLRLTFGRTPIGASDYAISAYSLDDTPGDYAMAHFSIDRDKEKLLPYIFAAQAIQPGLTVWGVPWSPPAWMKDSNTLIGGRIKTDPQTLNALALYFEKYVQAYQAAGVNLRMVMPQNEPTITSNYTSCLWTGAQLHNFIKNYLGPKFAADSLPCDIWLGTLQNSDYTYVADTVDDSASLAMIKGIAFQWDGARSCAIIHREHPELKLMQSETECGHHENDWHYAEGQYDLIKQYFEAGVSSYQLWNMVLDETGKSFTGWAQCSPLIIDTKSKKIIFTPQFYVFKHFSHYVEPGAVRVLTSGSYRDHIAFINPNGDVVLVLKNGDDDPVHLAVDFDGQKVEPVLPPHSFNTLVIHQSP